MSKTEACQVEPSRAEIFSARLVSALKAQAAMRHQIKCIVPCFLTIKKYKKKQSFGGSFPSANAQ